MMLRQQGKQINKDVVFAMSSAGAKKRMTLDGETTSWRQKLAEAASRSGRLKPREVQARPRWV
jgi:hypothetical protein